MRDPTEMGRAEVEGFLSALALRARVSASTQNQALSALLFLWREVLGRELPWLDGLVRARVRKRLLVVLTSDEVRRILAGLDGAPRIMAMLLYGSGLRLLECARLRVKDVDFARGQLTVRSGKGDIDRVTLLPVAVREPLGRHLAEVRRRHQADVRGGAGWVELPGALGRKYPRAGREWGWQRCFPPPGSTSTERRASAGATIFTSRCSSGR